MVGLGNGLELSAAELVRLTTFDRSPRSPTPLKTRPVTYDEFVERMDLLFPADNDINQTFRPRPTDVIISPFAKCGTTWLQQIVHGIRTGGDMDFEDIYDVVPWIDVARELGHDLEADQRAEPRAFKSHCSWDDVPKGCTYIVSFRDPKDAAVSMYRFMEGWYFEPGTIPIDEFIERRVLDRETGSDYWQHLASWLTQRDNPNVLLVTYEEMKDDLRSIVETVAHFLAIETDEARLDIATRQATFEFMSTNKGPFAEPLIRARSEEVADLPPGSDAAKVRGGNVGDHRHELSLETAARFDEIWADTIEAEFGFLTYQDLAVDLRHSRRS